jgi:asparagine N-glycosylation enzyme membrane subunit Stt3
LALLGVLFYFAGDYSLVTDFMTCKGFCSEDDFSATLVSGVSLLCSLLIFVLLFKFEKTRKIAAILNLLTGSAILIISILLLPMDDFSISYITLLSPIFLVFAGLLFFLKEKKAENSLKGL